MGIFNANAPDIADLNLLFQIAILVFLVVGVLIARLRRRFTRHGGLMGIAVVFNTISMGVVMIPSFLSFRGLFSAPLTRPAWIVLAHAIMGSFVEILGIWLVATWMFNNYRINSCVKRRNIMRATILFWLIELFLGIYIYTMLYVLG